MERKDVIDLIMNNNEIIKVNKIRREFLERDLLCKGCWEPRDI
jgi:hypothetical protein